jgi:hypothetical protein
VQKQPNRILISKREKNIVGGKRKEKEENAQQEIDDDCKENSWINYHLVLAIEQRAFFFSTLIRLFSLDLIIHDHHQNGLYMSYIKNSVFN